MNIISEKGLRDACLNSRDPSFPEAALSQEQLWLSVWKWAESQTRLRSKMYLGDAAKPNGLEIPLIASRGQSVLLDLSKPLFKNFPHCILAQTFVSP